MKFKVRSCDMYGISRESRQSVVLKCDFMEGFIYNFQFCESKTSERLWECNFKIESSSKNNEKRKQKNSHRFELDFTVETPEDFDKMNEDCWISFDTKWIRMDKTFRFESSADQTDKTILKESSTHVFPFDILSKAKNIHLFLRRRGNFLRLPRLTNVENIETTKFDAIKIRELRETILNNETLKEFIIEPLDCIPGCYSEEPEVLISFINLPDGKYSKIKTLSGKRNDKCTWISSYVPELFGFKNLTRLVIKDKNLGKGETIPCIQRLTLNQIESINTLTSLKYLKMKYYKKERRCEEGIDINFDRLLQLEELNLSLGGYHEISKETLSLPKLRKLSLSNESSLILFNPLTDTDKIFDRPFSNIKELKLKTHLPYFNWLWFMECFDQLEKLTVKSSLRNETMKTSKDKEEIVLPSTLKSLRLVNILFSFSPHNSSIPFEDAFHFNIDKCSETLENLSLEKCVFTRCVMSVRDNYNQHRVYEFNKKRLDKEIRSKYNNFEGLKLMETKNLFSCLVQRREDEGIFFTSSCEDAFSIIPKTVSWVTKTDTSLISHPLEYRIRITVEYNTVNSNHKDEHDVIFKDYLIPHHAVSFNSLKKVKIISCQCNVIPQILFASKNLEHFIMRESNTLLNLDYTKLRSGSMKNLSISK